MTSSENEMEGCKQSCFTIVELLTVTSVLLVLTSLLQPIYKHSMMHSLKVNCSHNLKQLIAGWNYYADDNDMQVPSSFDNKDKVASSWIDDREGNGGTGVQGGVLFPYLNDKRVYQCPEDEKHESSYQMSGTFNYQFPDFVTYGQGANWTSLNDLLKPSETMLFLEENSWRIEANDAWLMNVKEKYWWHDDVASWHYAGMHMAFPDGHTQYIGWTDPRTSNPPNPKKPGANVWHLNQPGNEDVLIMKRFHNPQTDW